MLQSLKNIYLFIIRAGDSLQSFVLLAMRLYWGWELFNAGRNKLLNIIPIIEYFQELSIPFSTANAYIAASVECFGGICLMLGFASRLVSVPLMIVMAVALVTAHHDAFIKVLSDSLNFIQQTPFTFFLTSLIVFSFGPGAISLDALIKRIFFKKILIKK